MTEARIWWAPSPLAWATLARAALPSSSRPKLSSLPPSRPKGNCSKPCRASAWERGRFTKSLMIADRRVVITGLGVVTPIGNDVDTFWRNLQNGVSGIGKIQAFDTTAYDCQIA